MRGTRTAYGKGSCGCWSGLRASGSADRPADKFLNPRLDSVGPVDDCERHRPHVPVVESGAVVKPSVAYSGLRTWPLPGRSTRRPCPRHERACRTTSSRELRGDPGEDRVNTLGDGSPLPQGSVRPEEVRGGDPLIDRSPVTSVGSSRRPVRRVRLADDRLGRPGPGPIPSARACPGGRAERAVGRSLPRLQRPQRLLGARCLQHVANCARDNLRAALVSHEALVCRTVDHVAHAVARQPL